MYKSGKAPISRIIYASFLLFFSHVQRSIANAVEQEK